MKKIVIFLVVLSFTTTFLTANPTPARAHHWHYWHPGRHWGYFWPGFAAGVGAGFIINPFFYPPRYYYPPAYAYPPSYNYPPAYGYNGGYQGEENNGGSYQSEGNYEGEYQGEGNYEGGYGR